MASASSSKDGGAGSTLLDPVLGQLSNLLALVTYDKEVVNELVGRVVSIGTRHGFTHQQAIDVVRLVLRGGASGRTVNSRVGLKLLSCVHPAKGVQLGETVVLIIVGALGPAEDAIIDPTTDVQFADHSDDDGMASSDGEGGERPKTRRKIPLGVQAAALKLLLLLLSPPVVLTDEGESMATMQLPTHFLSKRARRLVDRCYGLFFHYLDYQTLRPHLCHILSLIIRRKHVRRHRIDKLLSLRSHDPHDSKVEALISTHNRYLPGLQFSDAASAPSTALPHSHPALRYPDARWLTAVRDIWNGPRKQDRESSAEVEEGHARKRQKRERFHRGLPGYGEALPPLASVARSLLPPPTVLVLDEKSVLVDEVMTYKGLGYTFDRLQLPSQLVTALVHPMTAVATLAESQSEAVQEKMARITYWGMSALGEEMNLPASKLTRTHVLPHRNMSSHRKSSAMLHVLCTFVQRMGACNGPLQQWTCQLLQPNIWFTLDGEEKRAILGLVQMFVPTDWAKLSNQLVDPMRQLLRASSAGEASQLLGALRRMVERWVLDREWPAMILALEADVDAAVYFSFQRLSSQTDYISTLGQAIEAIVEESSLLLVRYADSVEVLDETVALYETIFSSPFIGLHTLSTPPRYPLYLFSVTQHGSIVVLSRLFAVMKQISDLQWTNIFAEDEAGREKEPRRMTELREAFYSDESRNACNAYSIFVIDLIWRSNGFGTVRRGYDDSRTPIESRIGIEFFDTGIPQEFFNQLAIRCSERGGSLELIGTISHSAVLGSLMEVYTNEVASEARSHPTPAAIRGPITSNVVRKAQLQGAFPPISFRLHRINFVDWLGEIGARGISDYLHVTVSRLLNGQGLDRTRDQSVMTTLSA